jgi:hypothetical protein
MYEVGTKIQVRTKPTVLGVNGAATGALGATGHSTFIYLKLEENDDTYPCLIKHICAQHSHAGTAGSDGMFDVTNDAGNDIGAGQGPIAIALSTMTEDYFGWFWCGGLCPEFWVPDLGGNFCTATAAVTVGDLTWADATAAATYGDFGLEVVSAVMQTVIGYSTHTDA